MDELPRKEAVRAVLKVINSFRRHFPTDVSGFHREIANQIVDRCEDHTGESKYKTRFLVTDGRVTPLVKHEPVGAYLDLKKLHEWCERVAEGEVVTSHWSFAVAKFRYTEA